MVVPLLSTKLFLPAVRAERVQRERLLARMEDTLRPTARLALISAPAGFGKTSLLAEWLARRDRPAAWVSLDSGDNSVERFLAYLTSAIQRARPGLLGETPALLDANPPAPRMTLLTGLINELAGSDPGDPLVIALDDFQFVTSAEVREVVAFLVENLPPGLRLVIATRSDPPLPLARLRARGQMVELRAADLRFTPEEAATFLVDVMGLRLAPESAQEIVTALTARTEGWAAGLQMAALALQSTPGIDSAEFVRTFTGSHRYVLDYLAEEVLARLPDVVVAFLLKTSLLERFCAGLAGEMIRDEAGRETADPEALILELDRSNLFLVPLDAERRWFRYHHLFADLLEARLKQVWPEQVAGLHRRAAAWYERSGLIAEAIQHDLSAAASDPHGAETDYERAARLVETHTHALFSNGQLHALLHWISLLPTHLADQRPYLCIYRAWIHTFSGELAEVGPLLLKAEALRGKLSEPERRELEGQCAAIRCHRAAMLPGSGDPFALGREAEAKLPDSSWALNNVRWSMGFALRGLGQLEQAAEIFERLAQASRGQQDWWGMAMICTDLGIVRRQQGRLREARQVFQSALAFVDEHGARRFGYTGRLLTGLAGVLYDQNDLDAAQRVLEEALELNQRWRNPNHLVFCYLHYNRLLIAKGDFAKAEQAVEAAQAVLRELPVIATLTQGVENAAVTLRLAQGQVPSAGGALEAQVQQALHEDFIQGTFNEPREGYWAQLARILIAQRRPAEALALLAQLETAARQYGRWGILTEMLALKALACYLKGDSAAALAALEASAALGEPQGAVRAIIDTAPLVPGGLRQLLDALRRRSSISPAYLDTLTGALPPEPDTATAAPEGRPAPGKVIPLVEALSERELEVLRLLSEGLTNAQIAERLVITTGTVKAHTAAIFRKLDVANRTQAVARARELGIQ